jgi:E3 ubiquitin-protein ligase UBR4
MSLFVNVCRYGKTKDAFGWPEETEDLASTSAAATQTAAGTSTETDNVAVAPVQLTSLDRCVPTAVTFHITEMSIDLYTSGMI